MAKLLEELPVTGRYGYGDEKAGAAGSFVPAR
jgi:hypothetical protein